MVRADYAGCGKTFACEYMKSLGHTVLFVVPNNELINNTTCDGVTVNIFFSVGMTEESKMKKFDSSMYDVIVFDEICLVDLTFLSRIRSFCSNNADKIIVATGDTKQLKPINAISNCHEDQKAYRNHCINTIFPYNINLKIIKRAETPEDMQKLIKFTEDIFDESIPVKTTLQKYFTFTKDITTETNIAHTNDMCSLVASIVRKNLNKSSEYEVGEILVCRKYFKIPDKATNKHIKFNVNIKFMITNIDKSVITIRNCNTDETTDVNITLIRDSFILGYCRTSYSYQGSTIRDKMTIFEWDHYFVDREWIYTAITRCNKIGNVLIYNGGYKTEEFNKQKLECYLTKKINGYIAQDNKAKRKINKDNYITKVRVSVVDVGVIFNSRVALMARFLI